MVEGKGNIVSDVAMAFLGMLMAILLAGCGSSTELSSSWTSYPVAVDDSVQRWGTSLVELKDTHVSLGVENDTGYVYLCLAAPQEQFRRQMLAPGLTLWFESDNGKKMGIHYPMGFSNQGPPSYPGEGNTEPEAKDRMTEQSLHDLEILGPGKNDRNLLSIVELPGIKLKIGQVGGQTVYELKVPLRESVEHPYAAGVSPGSTLKLEVESGKFESRRLEGMSEGGGMRGGGRRGGRGGGLPGGGGVPGGGRRGGGGFGGGNRPEPIELSVKIQLAGAGH